MRPLRLIIPGTIVDGGGNGTARRPQGVYRSQSENRAFAASRLLSGQRHSNALTILGGPHPMRNNRSYFAPSFYFAECCTLPLYITLSRRVFDTLSLPHDARTLATMRELAFAVFSGLSVALLLLPAPWHIKARNSGTLIFIFWALLGNIVALVNTVIWSGNISNPVPVWCDISTFFPLLYRLGSPRPKSVKAHHWL
jgi:hypothetical protein